MSGQRANHQIAIGLDALQFAEAANVYQERWLGEAEFHGGQQAVSTGKEFSVLLTADRADRLGQAVRTSILKVAGPHGYAPPFCPTAFCAVAMACQTLAEVMGIWICSTPNGRSASITALYTV